MNILSGSNDFFGLDIGDSAIRLVQLKAGSPKKNLLRYAFVPIDFKISQSDSKTDQQKLLSLLADLISKSGIDTKNVAVGVSSSKLFTTVADIDKLSKDELSKAIYFQIDSLIPTSITETKVDWSLLGTSPINPNKDEVLISSIPNSTIGNTMDMIESIGLNVIAFEPDSIALTRALLVPGNNLVQLILDIGSHNTDLVIVVDELPSLIRSVPIGTESFVRNLAQDLNVVEDQARQLLFKFGLSKNKIENQVYNPLLSSTENMASEIDKSIKFFLNRHTNSKIEKFIVTGGASSIPEFPLFLANKFHINVEIGNPWINVNYDLSRQNELLSISNHFAVAVGLAERTNA
jgi:type IV pilus assembly protein PilM